MHLEQLVIPSAILFFLGYVTWIYSSSRNHYSVGSDSPNHIFKKLELAGMISMTISALVVVSIVFVFVFNDLQNR